MLAKGPLIEQALVLGFTLHDLRLGGFYFFCNSTSLFANGLSVANLAPNMCKTEYKR